MTKRTRSVEGETAMPLTRSPCSALPSQPQADRGFQGERSYLRSGCDAATKKGDDEAQGASSNTVQIEELPSQVASVETLMGTEDGENPQDFAGYG